MTLPNFLIIGAAKCATTSLASLLDAHPQAAIVRDKEPHFFSYNKLYRLGIEAYKKHYEHCTNEIAIGDASTSYSRIRQHPKTISRIKLHLGNPKIIYMVRHPIERIESAYIEQMTNRGNHRITSINEAVEKLPMMIDSSRYWETYDAYRKAFGSKQIKVVWFEEYSENLSVVYNKICEFLNVDNSIGPNPNKENTNSRSSSKQRIPTNSQLSANWNPQVLKSIKKTLENDNQKFLTHFKKPLDYWK